MLGELIEAVLRASNPRKTSEKSDSGCGHYPSSHLSPKE
jgi:hypothetical protein